MGQSLSTDLENEESADQYTKRLESEYNMEILIAGYMRLNNLNQINIITHLIKSFIFIEFVSVTNQNSSFDHVGRSISIIGGNTITASENRGSSDSKWDDLNAYIHYNDKITIKDLKSYLFKFKILQNQRKLKKYPTLSIGLIMYHARRQRPKHAISSIYYVNTGHVRGALASGDYFRPITDKYVEALLSSFDVGDIVSMKLEFPLDSKHGILSFATNQDEFMVVTNMLAKDMKYSVVVKLSMMQKGQSTRHSCKTSIQYISYQIKSERLKYCRVL